MPKKAKKARLKGKDAPEEEETEKPRETMRTVMMKKTSNRKAGESDVEKDGVKDEPTENQAKEEYQKTNNQEKNVEGKKKRKHDAPGPISNGHSSPAKKARIANAESNMVVILDGQSIARGRDSQCLNLTPWKKLSVALDHFEKKGFKVAIFLPKTEVGPKSLSLQSRVTRNVKKVMKLTGKFVPDNEWGMDKREVSVHDVKKWNLWYRCAFSRSDVAFSSYMIQE